MMRFRLWPLLVSVLLAGCVIVPSGRGVVVLPGAGKTFEQFREEDAVCRHYAQDQVGANPEQAAADSVARSAGTGALLGAAAGALLGAGSHDPGLGAAIGAGSGLLFGGVAGSTAAGTAADVVQGRYDISYVQCMYAKGNRVPPPPGTPGYPLPPPPHPGASLPPPPPK
jgi:OmpA family protein